MAAVAPTDGFVLDEAAPRWQLSPLTRRRWANFKSNRRGYYSLWIVGSLMLLFLMGSVLMLRVRRPSLTT